MSLEHSELELQAFTAIMNRLSGFDEERDPEWADGYLTAVAAGPRAVDIDEWLPLLCGEAFERCFADPADAALARSALAARARLLARQLDPERLLDAPDAMHLTPLMWAWDDESRARAVADGAVPADEQNLLVTGASWSRGFFEAIRDFAEDWGRAASADDSAEVQAIAAEVGIIGWSDDSPEMADYLATYAAKFKQASPPSRDDLIDMACMAIQDLRLWWLDHPAKPATIHVQAKPGRNEPCFCGSGKKYKKCHGA